MMPDQLVDRLVEAGRTLKRLPLPPSAWPAKMRAVWPEAPDEWSAYGYNEVRVHRVGPSPDEIDRCDEVLGWLLWLEPDVRKLVLARAQGASWRRIMKARKRAGVRGSHETCRKIWFRGLAVIAGRLDPALGTGTEV